MDIKLLPVEEVLKLKSSASGNIQLDVPINVFAQSEAPAAPVQNSEPIVNLFEIATPKVEAQAPLAEAAPKIELQLAQPETPVVEDQQLNTSSGISIHLEQQEAVPQAAINLEPSIHIEQPVFEQPVIEPPAVEAPVMVQQIDEVSDSDAAKDLPYLFSESGTTMTSMKISKAIGSAPSEAISTFFSGNTGSIGVGESSNGDVENLKNYLTMREQDIAVLKVQLAYARDELSKSGDTIRRLTVENEDLGRKVEDLQRKNQNFNQEKAFAAKAQESELESLRIDMKAKIDKIKMLDEKLLDSADQYEKLKERVRHDIRKIRVREKELESKLEILKRDSETLISSRESKILELKRKIDLLEFNYDMLNEKNEHEKQNILKEREKDDQVKKVLRLALGMLNEEIAPAEAEKTAETLSDVDFEPEVKIA